MSEEELKAIEAFIQEVSLPSFATRTERLLHAAVKGDMGKLAAEVRRCWAQRDAALAAGHCYPGEGSDREACLIDHVELGHRDRIQLREEVERLRERARRASSDLGDSLNYGAGVMRDTIEGVLENLKDAAP